MPRIERGYDTAQVCNNGHVITQYAESNPDNKEKFCSKCGQPTITQCPNCSEKIRGYYHVPHVIAMASEHAPSFCHNCGTPYPWTVAKIEAAKELVDTLNNISLEEQKTLKQSIDDIARDSPRTNVAALKFKQIGGKIGIEAVNALKEILIGVTTEAAKKALGW